MEEILEKIEKLNEYAQIKSDLEKQRIDAKFDEREAEIESKKKNLSMSIGSITAPVLEEEIKQAEDSLNADKAEYSKKYDETKENFGKDKDELKNTILIELSRYKRREEIEKVKQDLEIQKEQINIEFEQRREEEQKKIDKLEGTKKIYMKLADEAQTSIDRANEDFKAGRVIDQENLRIAREDVKANKNKVFAIDTKIDGIIYDFENEFNKRADEFDAQMSEINSYKTIEDHIEEIRDLEHLRDSINSISFENVSEIEKNPNVISIKEREEKKKQASKPDSTIDSDTATLDSSTPEPDLQSEPDILDSKTDSQPTTDTPEPQPIPNNSNPQPTLQVNSATTVTTTSVPTQVIFPKIKAITIGKGVVIEYENGMTDLTKIKQKAVRNMSKADSYTKSEMITDIAGDFMPLSEGVLDKIDANVLYGLQKALKYEIPREHVVEVMKEYIGALSGIQEAKDKINGLITYDRTGMDYWKPKTFIDKIINHRYYNTMAEYMEKAKDFVNVVADEKGRTLRSLITGKKTKLLDAGKTKVDDIQKTVVNKVTEVKTSVQENVEGVKGKVSNTKQKVTDFRESIKARIQDDEEKITPSQTSSSREQSNENSKDGESR